jgi:hypothetical protein
MQQTYLIPLFQVSRISQSDDLPLGSPSTKYKVHNTFQL